jgi:hypothetical protein
MTDVPALDLKAFLPYLVNVLASGASDRLAAVYQAKFGISIPEWRVIAHPARGHGQIKGQPGGRPLGGPWVHRKPRQ